MTRGRILSLTLALAALSAAVPARATTLVRMSLSQLAQASNAIVIGQVVSAETRWNATHTRIMTYTTVSLEKALKGQPPSNLVVEQPGGTIGNFHVRVPGTPLLRPESSYVLFLQSPASAPSVFLVVGMMQGAFRIYRGGSPVTDRVILPLGKLSAGAGGQALTQSLPLEEFHVQVKKALAAPLVVPQGTTIPLVIESVQFQGSGHLALVGRTTGDVFPSHSVVIPAGSQVQGTAVRAGGTWKIYWTSVSVHGQRSHISGANQASTQTSLKGQAMTVEVRRQQ